MYISRIYIWYYCHWIWFHSHLNALCRSTEHDHVKSTILARLCRIRNFGLLPLADFKDLISPEEYQYCEKVKAMRPSWFSLTVNVFMSFLYKVQRPFQFLFLETLIRDFCSLFDIVISMIFYGSCNFCDFLWHCNFCNFFDIVIYMISLTL